MRRRACGPFSTQEQGGGKTEVSLSHLSPVWSVWSCTWLFAALPYVPDLFSFDESPGRNPRRSEVKLVVRASRVLWMICTEGRRTKHGN
jgi:hypothetical protein